MDMVMCPLPGLKKTFSPLSPLCVRPSSPAGDPSCRSAAGLVCSPATSYRSNAVPRVEEKKEYCQKREGEIAIHG
eukprot:3994358-Heterocapsa_arctica.AAC.1